MASTTMLKVCFMCLGRGWKLHSRLGYVRCPHCWNKDNVDVSGVGPTADTSDPGDAQTDRLDDVV